MWAFSFLEVMFKNKSKWFQQLLYACVQLSEVDALQPPASETWIRLPVLWVVFNEVPEVSYSCFHHLEWFILLHFFLMCGPCKVRKDKIGLWCSKSTFWAEDKGNVRGKGFHCRWGKQLDTADENVFWTWSLLIKIPGFHCIKESWVLYEMFKLQHCNPHVIVWNTHSSFL